MNTRPKTPPEHLDKPTRRWWAGVVADFDLDEHHVRLLTLAAEAWDRGQQARRALAKKGLTFLDRFGSPKPHPEVAIERDSRIAFARMVRELALDVIEPNAASQPQKIRGRSHLRIVAHP